MSIFNTNPTRRNRERTVKYTWELGDTTANDGKPATAVAQLYVSHDSNRKMFTALAQRLDVRKDGDVDVELFTIVGGTRVRLGSRPCARYSAKALDEAAQAALAELRSRVDEPEVVALADPTSPA